MLLPEGSAPCELSICSTLLLVGSPATPIFVIRQAWKPLFGTKSQALGHRPANACLWEADARNTLRPLPNAAVGPRTNRGKYLGANMQVGAFSYGEALSHAKPRQSAS